MDRALRLDRPAAPRRDRGDDFVATGPDTTAGRYLRSYWQPVYHSVDLTTGEPVPLRVMGESFTLYRGASGDAHIVESRCPHRGALLSSGWVAGDDLRCFYHGWRFAPDGRCIEQPAEESSYCEKVRIRSVPACEYLGFVFAFLGEGVPPQLPRYPEFEHFTGLLEIDSYVRDCNYYQNLENALDMSHVGFTHGNNMAAFDGIGLGRSLSAEESVWGVTYSFRRADGALRVQQFGMPNVFFMNALPTDADIGWQESLFWWVPIDDERHMQFSLHRVRAQPDAIARIHARREARRRQIVVGHQVECERVLAGEIRLADIDAERVDMIRLQDDIAQLSQGRIADRNCERLGRADVGVIAIRKLWRRELDAFAAGTPLTAWQRDDSIALRAWTLESASPIAASDESAEAQPHVIDIRPDVEVRLQRAALHGVRALA